MGGFSHLGPFTTSASDADPLIYPNQYHWVFAQEAYATNRRPNIDGWMLDISMEDMCLYKNDEFAIVAFRGSVTTADIRDDIRLSKPGDSGCAFDRVNPALHILRVWLDENSQALQCTGHSLGGAIAKCVGAALSLGVVTFNPAAPPSNPTSTGPNQINYHIVFDIISAWIPAQRIDKGFRPKVINKFLNHIPYASKLMFNVGIRPILTAHEITSFGKNIKGQTVTSEFENDIWQKWFGSMPRVIQKAFLVFIQAPSLPPVP